MSALRRYQPMKASRGTVWPPEVKAAILRRDGGECVGPKAGFPRPEFIPAWHPEVEIDHVRASHGMGMKSRSTEDNGVLLCPECHRWKTEHGKEARPLLLDYLSRFYPASVA